ncbi:G-type lectin S-receptor-like serine/threonine-protein kinase At2g19130 [Curcuma longa]|uniref:G-type lectin S-receptor-like serine/threonine-protein kinase At2g19130 n=1 Tax=Curcuma longa TaxID=136217 RepID=UPI003D9EEAFD
MVFPRIRCIFPLLPLLFNLCSAVDTIFVNSSLSGNQTITSSGGNFVLGFFAPGNSDRYYIGIWYGKVPLTSVWVANRETPVADPFTSVLKISTNGNLVLRDSSNALVWSTDANTTTNSTVAVLRDSGNLQLCDASNYSRVVWQSMDHPTDTWLPGGKLGLNKLTGVSQRLTAWKNSDDPAPGMFNLELDPNGTSQYFIMWNSTFSYWTSGTWNGYIFSLVPEMTANFNYDFQYFNNSVENYFTYSTKSSDIISRFVMDSTGQIKQWTWLDDKQLWTLFWSKPDKRCLVHSLCGAFGSCNENAMPICRCVEGFRVRNQSDWDLGDQSGGCTRNTPLQCSDRANLSNSQKDKFLAIDNMRLPVNNKILNGIGSDEDCQLACLNNCSCTAYSFSGSRCSVWHGELFNLQDHFDESGASTLQLRLAASELSSPKSNKTLVTWAVVAAAAAAVVASSALILFVAWRRRRSRLMGASKAVGGGLVPFRYSELRHMTKNFSHRLGGGGFGSVFKGSFPNSTPIAVKRLEALHQGEKQFRTEVSIIGTIQHVNLVRLIGFCSEGANRLLVYELMPKGSLDTHLFSATSTVLNWKTRYQIAVGTARGLTYLHEQCRDCIIHCDIKPENILLDDSLTPKLADFGLAKLMGRDFSRVLTTMRGTRGYLAPEMITGLPITAKADVYSYGMMLFEIVSGRRNLEEGNTAGFFPTLVINKLMEKNIGSVLDQRLGGDVDLEELNRVCKLACWCIQDNESCRPTMGQVLQALEGFLEVSMPPIPRSLLRLLTETPEKINFFYQSLSANEGSQSNSDTPSGWQTRSSTSNNSSA